MLFRSLEIESLTLRLQALEAERIEEPLEEVDMEATEAELLALQAGVAHPAPDRVHDLYARANAELNAVKNDLLRRPKESTPAPEVAASTPKPEEPG